MRGGTHGRHVLGKAVEVRGVLGHAHGRHAGKNRHLGERASPGDNARCGAVCREGHGRRACRLLRRGARIWLRGAA